MKPDPPSLLGGLDVPTFLSRHWQKEPLLVRGALPEFELPLTPEELAGLALDEDVTSRLVLEIGGERPWQVRHGPFTEEDFTSLGSAGWSLMVQEVDQLVPAADALLSHFRFVPNWRIDDVMVSYAPAGGGVGAHVDRYDVFLVQGLGRRRWQIQRAPIVDERLVPDVDVRLLADFAPDDEWVLEPGDLLYLPPGIAHHGVALDPCMTFSIGFRAPDAGELCAAFLTHVVEAELADSDDVLAQAARQRFADPDLPPRDHPGEIDAAARRRMHALVRHVVNDEQAFDRWLGRFLTAPHRISPRQPDAPVDPVAALEAGGCLLRSAVPHFAHATIGGTTYLYVGSEEYRCREDVATLLTGTEPLTRDTLRPAWNENETKALLATLVEAGYLEVGE